MRPALHSRGRGLKKFSSYQFRKSRLTPRIYRYQAAGSAANTQSWLSATGAAIAGGYVTSHICMTAEAPYTGVKLIFSNGDATPYTITGASVAPGATLGDQSNTTASGKQPFVAVTFGGNASGTVPAAANNKPGILVSDLIPITSMTRLASDSSTWTIAAGKLGNCDTAPLLHIRVAQPTAATNSNLLGILVGHNPGSTDAPYQNGSVTKTGKYISCQNNAAATPQLSIGSNTAFTGTGTSNYGPFCGIINMPIVGVVFEYASNAMSVAVNGDSISDGAGISAAQANRPFGRIACETASTPSKPVEFCMLTLIGASSGLFEGWFENIIANGIIPTHSVFPTTSPNDGATGPGATQVTTTNQWITTCAANNIYPITWTAMPVGTTAPQKYTNAGETARLNWNVGLRAGGTQFTTAKPLDYMEFDQAVIGGEAVSDNATPIASFTLTPQRMGDSTYNLHPTSYCDTGLATGVMLPKLQSIAAAYYA